MTEKTLDKYFSKYIRLRDRIPGTDYCQCATCSTRKKWSEMDAGHFMSRRHKATKYNEMNVLAQCPACNRFNQGKQYEMGISVNKKFGEGTTDLLLAKSREPYKLNKFEIDEKGKYYREQCKILEAA